MEPITTLALFCNVLEISNSCIKVIRLCKKLKKHGTTQPELAGEVSIFKSQLQTLHLHLHPKDEHTCLDAGDQKLFNLSRECFNVAEDVGRELQRLGVCNGKGRAVRAIPRAFTSLWRANKIKSLQAHMENLREMLKTEFLFDIR